MQLARLDTSHIQDTISVLLSLEQHGYFLSIINTTAAGGQTPDTQAGTLHKCVRARGKKKEKKKKEGKTNQVRVS